MNQICFNLHTETPIAKAVFNLFSALGDLLIERATELKPGVVRAYIFGGCAMHIYTNARGSNDLDVHFEASKQLNISDIILELDDEYFDDPELGASSLSMDSNFNIGITDLTPDYQNNAILLSKSADIIHVYLISALDIAVSKISRSAGIDLDDVRLLLAHNRIDLDELKEALQMAIEFSATPERLSSNAETAMIILPKN